MNVHEVKLIEVTAAEDGIRLDRWLRRRWPDLGQTQIHKLARSGQLRVDGGRVRAETRLAVGATVRVPPFATSEPARESEALPPRDVALARSLVIHEDADLLVLNKPAGLAVQGGTKTLQHVDRLMTAWGEGLRRPRLVHRLDRDTSGVLVLGKTPASAAFLAAAFAGRDARKTYWAVVCGAPSPAVGRIDVPLAKLGVDDRERMVAVDPDNPAGKRAVSEYVTLADTGEAAWLALRPVTGRTHQLRAHALAVGHPILGDPKYNSPTSVGVAAGLKLQLHARRLVLPHPSGGLLEVEAPIGPGMAAAFARFGFDEASAPEDPFGAPLLP